MACPPCLLCQTVQAIAKLRSDFFLEEEQCGLDITVSKTVCVVSITDCSSGDIQPTRFFIVQMESPWQRRLPKIRISFEHACRWSPTISAASVDLPEPLGPVTSQRSPSLTAQLKSRRTSCLPQETFTPCISTTGMPRTTGRLNRAEQGLGLTRRRVRACDLSEHVHLQQLRVQCV